MVNSVTGSQVTQTDVGWNALLDTTASWRVLTNWTIGCTPTRAGISTSRSNIRTKNGLAVVTGISQEVVQQSISIYPNPAEDYIIIDASGLNHENLDAKLFNAMGEMVYQTPITNSTSRIQVSSFAKGIYTVVVSGTGTRVSKKLVVN
jgi:hypothetical protein